MEPVTPILVSIAATLIYWEFLIKCVSMINHKEPVKSK